MCAEKAASILTYIELHDDDIEYILLENLSNKESECTWMNAQKRTHMPTRTSRAPAALHTTPRVFL